MSAYPVTLTLADSTAYMMMHLPALPHPLPPPA